MVWAPRSALMKKGRPDTIEMRSRPVVSSALPKPVATAPGCKQLTVTPVPSSRRASSVVNRMLASLDLA